VLTPTGRQSAEALVEGAALSSALAVFNANLEVGVGSFRESSAESNAVFDKFLTNQSANPVTIGFEFLIPAGAITLTDFSTPAFQLPNGPRAGVLALIEFGFGIDPLAEIFAFGAEARVEAGVLTHSQIGPMTAREITLSRGRQQLAFDEHRGRVLFPAIAPGETLHFKYTMNSFGSNDVIEWGYVATIGDPADFVVGGSGGFFVSPSAEAVPEPASLLLCGLGLVAIAATGRNRSVRRERA
jgi:hypothetical protein